MRRDKHAYLAAEWVVNIAHTDQRCSAGAWNNARQVAEALTAKDAFATHARDELGLSAHVVARPIQAALTSAVTFAFGAAIPLLIAIASPMARIPWVVSAGSLVALAVLGAAGAQTGGANVVKPMLRVTFWGAIAMGTTATIGRLVGHAL
jgi:VIT1/CCC1 family predicted Fe2+/Mn2+ transporter